MRPLFDDDAAKGASAVTRDYEFELDGGGDRAPVLSAFGGKLTTYRKLSEHALDKLAPTFPEMSDRWTATAPLPGGDMEDADFDRWFARFAARRPWLGDDLARHYGRCYGRDAETLLDGAAAHADLGRWFGGLLYEREARWLMEREWAMTAEDILTRRTKHGLFLTAEETAAFAAWISAEATV
ncbi:MAG: glycerol-3-phosphate dehydrogenase C-terminal domain-containing protein [Pseudomonadota bacterium]